VVPADVDETAIKRDLLRSGSTPTAIAAALAAAKGEAVSAGLPEALVIGADQVLALGQDLFSKPAGTSEAREQLLRLRGKSHQLHTAVSLATGGKAVWTHVEIATLAMRPFSDAFLADYLRDAGARVCHTVGAYEIEGPGIQLFERVEGDIFTVIGLPLLPLLAELRARGVIDT
jgi:septum formation protein